MGTKNRISGFFPGNEEKDLYERLTTVDLSSKKAIEQTMKDARIDARKRLHALRVYRPSLSSLLVGEELTDQVQYFRNVLDSLGFLQDEYDCLTEGILPLAWEHIPYRDLSKTQKKVARTQRNYERAQWHTERILKTLESYSKDNKRESA